MSARRARPAAALLVALLAVVGEAGAASPTLRLRYGLQPEGAYLQTTTLALALAIKAEGLPESAASIVQALAKDSKQDLTLQGRVEAGSKDADGGLPLSYRLVDAKGTLTLGGQTKDLLGDSQRFKDATLRGRLSPDGRTVAFEPGPAGAGSAFPPGLEERVAQSLPTFPDKDLAVGDSFEIPGGVSLPSLPGGAQSQLDSKLVFTLKSVSQAAAEFDVRQTMTVPPGTEITGNRTLTVSGGGTGTATYDRKEGLFTSLRLEMDVQVVMGLGPSMPAPAGQSGQSAPPPVVTLRAAVRGPMIVTMARATGR